MKTYTLILSAEFPVWHSRKGDPTFFAGKSFNAISNAEATLTVDPTDDTYIDIYDRKLHTIRANYPLWKKRIAEVKRGEACLSIRQWTGRPYYSKQTEIARLTNKDGVGIQRLEFVDSKLGFPRIGIVYQRKYELAMNDGLSFEDWENWFKNYDLTQPMAIIHFTKFRY